MSEDQHIQPPELPISQAEPQTDAAGQLPTLERSVMGSVGVALMGAGLRSGRPLQKLVLGGVGAGLAAMAATGRNPLATALKIRQTPQGEVLVSDAVTIGRSADDLYRVWRDLAGLPRLMTHLKAVEVLDERRSRWTTEAPTGTVSWEAELTADEPGRRIAWAALPGAAVENHGEVLFRPAPGDRGTEVVVRLAYRPPGGSAGAIAARLFGEEPAQQLRDDLMHFKREQELGFVPTTAGQSSARAGGQA
ncbi:SRPBCC family protein [Deinococcus soli (ex Cha et al. 2016)]|uniref:SRPBCC family protein n=1 Tax=Deinococcus soli (ex Cha et al. 2016) TaxID=1309411 RepID=UPI00166DADED|nr:SRPBCC family protein [Deinococcus soli (ex Cha et al. 2016)]GGB76942.1 cyclase [Deinococcus soli (ex Cha et al. 2016)]